MINLDDVGNLLDKCFVLLIEKRPGRTIIDTPELCQVIDPGMPNTASNAVYRTNFAEDCAEDRIAEAIGRFRSLGLPFRWTVNSLSRPKDLAARLTARKPDSTLESTGFAAPCELVPSLPAPHVTVEDLSAGNLQDYILAATESFAEIGQAPIDALRDLANDAIARPNPDSLSFLARYKGQPAGIGRLKIVRDGDRVAGYIAGGGVRPCFRHRGVVRLISHFAKELQRRGIPLLLAHANEKTSAPIMRRLGFREYGKEWIFVFSK